MADESIGGVSISVTGDFSDLDTQFAAAVADATQQGQTLAAAIQSAVDAPDASATVAAIEGIGNAAQQAEAPLDELGQKIQDLLASGEASTLAEALSQALSGIGDGASEGAAEMQPLSDAISSVGNAAGSAAPQLEQVGSDARTAGDDAQTASISFGDLASALTGIGAAFAFTDSLVSLGQDALTAADNITHASIALTAITGDADQAKSAIQGLEALGISDGLSFPSLLTAATRMQNLLGPGADVTQLLGSIANGAAVMGTNIDAAATKFDNMANSGTVAARSLTSLGLNLGDIANGLNTLNPSLNATATSAAALFKALDPGDRVTVLTDALSRLDGVAHQIASETFGGEWQILQNQFEQIAAEVGAALLPALTQVTQFISGDVVPAIKALVDGFTSLPQGMQTAIEDVGLLAAAIVPLTAALGGIALAVDALAGLGDAAAGLFGIEGGVEALGAAALVAAPAIIAIGGAIAVLNFSGVIDGIEQFASALSRDWGSIAQAFQPVSDALTEIKNTALNVVSEGFADWTILPGVIQMVTTAFPPLKGALDDIETAAKAGFQSFTLWDAIAPGLSGIGDTFRTAAASADALALSQQQVGAQMALVQAAFDRLNGSVSAYQSAFIEADGPLQTLMTHEAQLKSNLSDAQAALEAAKESLAGYGTNASGAAASANTLRLAQDAVTAATIALYGPMKAVADIAASFAQPFKEFNDVSTITVSSEQAIADSADALAGKIALLNSEINHAQQDLADSVQNLKNVQDAYAQGTASATDLANAEQKVSQWSALVASEQAQLTTALNANDAAWGVAATAAGAANEAFSQAGGDIITAKDNITEMGESVSGLASIFTAVQPQTDALGQALLDLGSKASASKVDVDTLVQDLKLVDLDPNSSWEDVADKIGLVDGQIQKLAKTDLPDATAALGGIAQGLIATNAPLSLTTTAMAAWEASINKLATEDLPKAIAQQDQYIASLVKMGAQISAIDAATIKADQMQIQLATDAVQTGDAGFGAASQYVLGIEKITLAEQAAHDEAVGFADVLVDGVKGLQTAWDSMDKTIADTIVNGGNWGAAWHTILKTFETDILEGVIKGALQPLEGLLLGLISSLITGVPSALSITGAGITALSTNAGLAGAALTNLAASANAAAASISASVGTSGVTGADGADTGGSGVLGALSNMADTLNLIANVIQAGAAIVGDVYLAAIDTKLFTVETDLHGILNEALNLRADQWNQFNGMMDRLGEIKLDADTMLVTLQAMYAGGTGAAGGIGSKAQDDLDTIATNSAQMGPGDQAINGTLQSILGQEQTIQTNTGAISGELQTINSTLMLVNQSVLSVVSAINYHGQANDIQQSMSMVADAATASGHAIVGAVTDGNNAAAGRGQSAQNAETINQQIQTVAQQNALSAAQAQYNAALSVADQIRALQSALTADDNLMQLALTAGNVALATQYQTAAAQLRSQLTSLEGSVGTVVTSVDRSTQDIVSASNEVGVSAANAGTLVAAGVSSAATQISSAVFTASANSAAVTSAAIGQLVSIIGAFGSAGGGLPGGLSGLPSGSGGSTAAYGGLGPPDAAPGYGQQPSGSSSGSPAFSPGSGATSGMTQAQWNATGHSGIAPSWWLNGTPQPGINEGGIPHFDEGGYVTADTLAQVHSGETVIPPGLTTSLGEFLSQVNQSQQTGTPEGDQRETDPVTGALLRSGLELAQEQVDAQETYLALAEANNAPPAMIDLLTKQLQTYENQLDAVKGTQKAAESTATSTQALAGGAGPKSTFPVQDNGVISTIQEQTDSQQADSANTQQAIETQTVYVQQTVMANAAAVAAMNTAASQIGALAPPKPLTGPAAIASLSGQGYYSGGYDPTPGGLPSYDVGGFVPGDMAIQAHAGEWVVPPDVTGMLRRMASTPSATMSFPTPSGATSNQSMVWAPVFNVYGGSAAENVRQIAQYMKTQSPKLAALSS